MPSSMDVAVPPAQMVSLTEEPFDAIAEQALGWDMRYDQLESGGNRCDLTQLRLGGVDVARERVQRTVSVHGTPPAHSIGFGLVAGSGQGATYRGRPSEPDTLLYQVANEDLDARFRGTMLSFVVDAEVLRRRMGTEALDAALRRDRLPLTVREARGLRALSQIGLAECGVRSELLASPAASSALADQLVTRLVDALVRAPGCEARRARPGPRPQRLAAAETAAGFIAANLDRRLTIDELVRVSSVKERALRSGFLERFGQTPQAYIASLRLNAVRRELRWGGTTRTVTEIATRHGFWHLGRFAQAYRRLFGELPSETKGRLQPNRADSG